MARLLVLGADGLIGTDIARSFAARGWDLLGTTRGRDESKRGLLSLDLANTDVAKWPLPRVDVAIFAAAMARFADCRAQPELARRVNVEAPIVLAERFAAAGTRCVLLSTSAVFDGSRPHVPADAPVSPTSLYGVLKGETERAFMSLGDLGSVVRLTKVLGPVHPLFAGWVAALRQGRTVEAYDDLRLAPIGLADVRAGLKVATERGGVVQVSGARDVSYLDLLRRIADGLGSSPGLVQGVSAAERGVPAADRPTHTSLDTATLSAEGWRSPDPFDLVDGLYLGVRPSA